MHLTKGSGPLFQSLSQEMQVELHLTGEREANLVSL